MMSCYDQPNPGLVSLELECGWMEAAGYNPSDDIMKYRVQAYFFSCGKGRHQALLCRAGTTIQGYLLGRRDQVRFEYVRKVVYLRRLRNMDGGSRHHTEFEN
jgi:hypothetical protein